MRKYQTILLPLILITLACDPEPVLLEQNQVIADAGHTGVYVLSEGPAQDVNPNSDRIAPEIISNKCLTFAFILSCLMFSLTSYKRPKLENTSHISYKISSTHCIAPSTF